MSTCTRCTPPPTSTRWPARRCGRAPAQAGRADHPFVLTVPDPGRSSATPRRSRPRWRSWCARQLGFYGSTPAYAFQFDRLGLDGLGGQLNALLKQGDLEGQARLLTDEVLAHFVVTATWDELPAALADRYAGGRADRLVAYLAQPMWQRDPATLERWGDVATRPADPQLQSVT